MSDLNAKVVEWRPECRAKMFDVVRRRDGSVAIRVQCRRCSGQGGRPVRHEVGIDELLRAVGATVTLGGSKSQDTEDSDRAD